MGEPWIHHVSKATAGDVLRQARKTEKLLKKKGSFSKKNINFVSYAYGSPLRLVKLVLLCSPSQARSGVNDHKISGLACRGRSKYANNASRNLYHYIKKQRMSLPVQVSTVDAPVRVSRRRVSSRKPWPVMLLSSWAKEVLEGYGGFFFFGGLTIDDLEQVETTLARFWNRFEKADGESTPHPTRTIPFFVHGDEGRGQLKRPVLVLSFQALLGWKKDVHLTMDDLLNSKKILGATHSFLFLYCGPCPLKGVVFG